LSVDALKLLKAYQRLDWTALAALRLPSTCGRDRSKGQCGTSCASPWSANARSLEFLDEVRRAVGLTLDQGRG